MTGELRVGLEAVDRADLREQLRSGQGATTGQLEQRGRGLRGHHSELTFELQDRACERATAAGQVGRDPHLQRLLTTSELARNPVQPDRPIERSRGHAEQRVEFVGAQPRRRQPPSASTCVRPLRSRSFGSPPPPLGATGERTRLTPGSCQAPIRSRSAVSDGGGDTTLASQPTGRQAGIESAAAARVCVAHRTPPPRRE